MNKNMESPTASRRSFSMQATAFLIVLAIQFLFGIAVNLFITIPKTSVSDSWRYAWTSVPVIIHMILGTGLLLGSIFFAVRTSIQRDRHWMIASILGFIGMAIAFIGGVIFIPTNSNPASFAMAFGFILGVLAYGWGLIRA